MNRRQRESKIRAATAHKRKQKQRKQAAIQRVMDMLKQSKKRGTQKQITDGMKTEGYIPNGRGGWRRLSKKARDPKNPTLSKS